MTNHWRDIRHADLILINGANPAEAHPVGFRWLMRAKLDRGAKIIHTDPRFTRTSAVADLHVRIRTGTDVAYFGGLINYVLENNLYHQEYVEFATNAGLVVSADYNFDNGMFNGFNQQTGAYNTAAWAYEMEDGQAKVDINHPRSVLNLLREHYKRYTPEMVERITGIPRNEFLEVAKLVGEMGRPDKVMTIVYAVGLTHHTTGVQLIRSGAILQLLLGNMGRPGGGMNAERGHANIQGNTDHAISWEILPGYLKIPAPGQKNLADYLAQSASKKLRPNSVNFFGENYRKFMVSLLKAWYGDAATAANEFVFDYLPKPAANASWISIFDQALRGKMEGVILSGMTATSIGPDSNQVLQALSNLKWLCVMDPFPTTSSEFWNAPGMDPAKIQTEVFMLPATHWIEKDGSFTNSGRWAQWKEQVMPPEGEARHDHWVLAELFSRVKNLYQQQGGKYPDPVLKLTLPYRDPRKPELDEIAQEINGKNLTTGQRLATFADLKDDGTTIAGDWIYTASYPESGNLTKRRNGVQDPAKNDPTGMGFYPNWAWCWPLNRRVMYNRASADPAGNRGIPRGPGSSGTPPRASGWATCPTTRRRCARPDPSPAAVHHEQRGHRADSSATDGGRAVPRALRAGRVAGPEPAAPAGVGDARGLPLRQEGGPAEPLRHRGGLPLRRNVLPAHRARALRHAERRAAGPAPAGGVRRGAGGAGQGEGHSDRRLRAGVVEAGQARGARGRDHGASARCRSMGRRSTRSGSRSTGASWASTPAQHWLANALTPFVGDASSRTPEFKAFLVNIEKM